MAGAFLSSAWAGLVALATQPARTVPTRVGVLNTGELVLVDGAGYAQVLNAETTHRVRNVLFGDALAGAELADMSDRAVRGPGPDGGAR